MRILYKNEQTGRSMVEMLGVLAIIGVLSIGGISGYSKAMSKYRINKTLDQISMLVMNIRSLFSSSVDYTGLDNTLSIQMGIIPADMQGATAGTIINAYQGRVFIEVVATDTRQFSVTYTGLTQEACVSLATADWGSQAGSGLQSMTVGTTADKEANTITQATGSTLTYNIGVDFPITLQNAAKSCSANDDNGNGIKWTYYQSSLPQKALL